MDPDHLRFSRRDTLAIMCLFASGSLTGCSGTETQTSKTIQIQPKNPQVGQTVQFIANVNTDKIDGTGVNAIVDAANADGVFYFWSFSTDMEIEAMGRRVSTTFTKATRHVVRLLAVDGAVLDTHYDGDPSEVKSIDKLTTSANPKNYYRHSISIPIAGLPSQRIDIETQNFNFYLKAQERNVTVDQSVVLEFSAANLNTNRALLIRLLIEVPTGLSVSGTSFQEGQGQFISSYTVSPGSIEGESIRITANSAGTYTIRGQVAYSLEGTSQSTQSQNITVQFNR